MRRSLIVITALVVSLLAAPLPGYAEPPAKPQDRVISPLSGQVSPPKPLDRSEILKANGVTAAFVLLQAEEAWDNASPGAKKAAVVRAKTLVEEYADRVVVDVYDVTGLSRETDLLLRLHAPDPDNNRKFIKKLMDPFVLGRLFRLQDTRLGITKGLNYAPRFPDLLEQLKAIQYEGPPPVFGIMVPVHKSAEWWVLPQKERLEMIKEHTEVTLPYIKDVKRKLYHSTGIGETDFVTFFEIANLEEFTNLIIALKSIKEGRYTTYGTPVVGRISTFEDALQ